MQRLRDDVDEFPVDAADLNAVESLKYGRWRQSLLASNLEEDISLEKSANEDQLFRLFGAFLLLLIIEM